MLAPSARRGKEALGWGGGDITARLREERPRSQEDWGERAPGGVGGCPGTQAAIRTIKVRRRRGR